MVMAERLALVIEQHGNKFIPRCQERLVIIDIFNVDQHVGSDSHGHEQIHHVVAQVAPAPTQDGETSCQRGSTLT